MGFRNRVTNVKLYAPLTQSGSILKCNRRKATCYLERRVVFVHFQAATSNKSRHIIRKVMTGVLIAKSEICIYTYMHMYIWLLYGECINYIQLFKVCNFPFSVARKVIQFRSPSSLPSIIQT